jgi:hypothetical protein
LRSDPREQQPQPLRDGDQTEDHLRELARSLDEHWRSYRGRGDQQRIQLDENTRERLRALGYDH